MISESIPTASEHHKAIVVPIALEKHPNADKLSIVQVYGYTVCCNTEEWKDKTSAVYLAPDCLVDTQRDEFSFLKEEAKYYLDSLTANDIVRAVVPTYYRIKAKKLRGVVSYGLLIPTPNGAQPGDDVTGLLGVLHYESPVMENTKGEVAKGPKLLSPRYDIKAYQRYGKQLFEHGEAVVITEKIHGCNARFVYSNGEYFCGSRDEWKREYPIDKAEVAVNQNLWWKALRATPTLMKWLKDNPDIVAYGEVYGQIQKGFPYDCKPGEVKIAVFDLFHNGSWVDSDICQLAAPELPWVPRIEYNQGFDFESLLELADGQSLLAKGKHMREGIVIKPIQEREHYRLGRVQLKMVSANFLNKG